MSLPEYRKRLRALLSGSAEEMRKANAQLLAASVPEKEREDVNPDLVLADAAADL